MAIKKPNLKPRSAPVAEAAVVDPNPPAPPAAVLVIITMAPNGAPMMNWQNCSPYEVMAWLELLREDLKGQLRGNSPPRV